jgi:integrase
MGTHRRPATLPKLARGQGSFGWDEARGKVTLRHRWGGQAHIERGDTFEECEIRRDRRRRDLDVRASLAGDSALAAVVAGWLEFQEQGHAEQTNIAYRWSARNIMLGLGIDADLMTATVGDVEDMWTALGRRLGPASMTKVRTHWGMILDYAGRRKCVTPDRLDELRSARVPPSTPVAVRRTFHDLAGFTLARNYLVADGGPLAGLFLLMMLCGLRPGEAMGLQWRYVDLAAGTLRVEGTIKRGRTANRGTYSTVLKTDHRHAYAHRTVPLATDLRLALPALQRHATGDFVCPGPHGDGWLSFDAVRVYARDLALALRVGHVTPNGYRHTFASVARHNGMPYEVLAKLMGHATTAEIIHTYGHPVADVTTPDIERYLGG